MTSFMSDMERIGCPRCAKFINKEASMSKFPLKPFELVNLQIKERNRLMAYNCLKSMIEKTEEENIMAFVQHENLVGVTKEVINFINKPGEFASYQRPLVSEKGAQPVEELKGWALANILVQLQEVGLSEEVKPQFKTSAEERELLRRQEVKYLANLNLESVLGPFPALDIDLESADFLEPGHLEVSPRFQEFFDRHSKGQVFACTPLSMLQNNYAQNFAAAEGHSFAQESSDEEERLFNS